MLARALIVLLLVLNFGVATWWLLRQVPSAPPSPTTRPDEVQRLRLVSELSPADRARLTAAPAPGQAPASPAEPVQDAGMQCHAFGPFATADAAEAARTALSGDGHRIAVRREAGRSGRQWDVVLPPQADRAAAQALAARIDAAGFEDYYVIAGGASANGIALGRFGNEEAARRHQAALQAAGFAAQLRPPDVQAQWWIDLQAAGTFDAQAARAATGAAQALACTTPG